MATGLRLSDSDWVEAEIARQLEQISLESDSDEEADIENINQCDIQVVPRSFSARTDEPGLESDTNAAYSVFQSYIDTLNNERTAAEKTLLEAHSTLQQRQEEQQALQVPHSSLNISDSEQKNPKHLEVAKQIECDYERDPAPEDLQVQPEVMKVSENNVEQSVVQSKTGGTDSVSAFTEETEEVKSTVEKYKQQQSQLEEQLSKKLQQREADLNAMIKESMEKRQKREEIIAERAKMDKRKRATAVVLLQAGVRGYLTRKKTTPVLMAARDKTRLERVKERERTRMVAATSIQAIWKGYRSRTRYKEALLSKRKAELQRKQAATVVQTWWRGNRAKQLLLHLKEEKLKQPVLKVDGLLQERSEGKLTVAKRIQSSLKVMKQASLGELPGSATLDSSQSGERATVDHEANDSHTSSNKQTSAEDLESSVDKCPSPDQRSPPSLASSERFHPDMCELSDFKSQSNVPLCALHQKQPPTLVSSPEKKISTESPQVSVRHSVTKPGGVVGSLVRSLSETDRKSLIHQLQQKGSVSSSSGAEVVRTSLNKQDMFSQSKSNQPAEASFSDLSAVHEEKTQSESTNKPTCMMTTGLNQTGSAPQPSQGTCAPCDDDRSSIVDEDKTHKEQALAEEQKALALLVERREAEEMVAQLSRQRMNSLLSEEELAEVAKRKRSHSTYRQELEHACTPLLPHAWLGVIEERMQEWVKRHKRWNPPANIQRKIPNLLEKKAPIVTTQKTGLQSRSSVGHFSSKPLSSSLHSVSLSPTGSQFSSTTKSLSDAQLLAASPRGTTVDEVACVMLYRSRGDVRIPDIGRRCPRVCSLSLTKCPAMTNVKGDGEEVGGVWEELIELNLQSNMLERVDSSLMKELRFVDLSDNRLASIHGLDDCPHLLELCLSDNRVARVSGGLLKCSGLQVLDIDSNLLINCKGLEDLPFLQRFSCAENHLPKVDGVVKCSLLQYLRLSQNNLQMHPSLCDHVLLRELYLDENSLSDITAITKSWLPLLQTLSLSNNCIMELSSLACLVMLKSLDVSNNSLYDLPLLLQGLRGCLQLQTLHLHGNPVAEEPRFRMYVSKALHSLSELDGEPIAVKSKQRSTPLTDTIKSSPIYQLCCHQIEEQDRLKEQHQMELEELKSDSSCSPSPENTRKILMSKMLHCHNYEKLLIRHLREHETITIARNKTSTNKITDKESSKDSIHVHHTPSELELRIKAAILIQTLVRGWLVRRRVKVMRQHSAATTIQAHYRGYLLRRRLREILDRAHCTVGGDEQETGGGGGSHDIDELEFEEEVLGLDYLDELHHYLEYAKLMLQNHITLLDADIKPLSPTNEHLIKYSTNQSLQAERHSNNHRQEHNQRPVLVPAYSLPGAMEEEVSFETWKRQQQEFIPANRKVHVIPSLPPPTTQHLKRDSRSYGESSSIGYCETDCSGGNSEKVAACEISQPRVQRAWESQTQLEVVEVEKTESQDSTCDSSRTSSATEVRDTPKKDKIISDWGFTSSTTADLMLKRMQRQKKLHSNAISRHKLNDPGHRLALFHKHKNQGTESESAINPISTKYKVKHRHHSAHATPGSSDGRNKEHTRFQWVHEQHLVHSREGTGSAKRKSSLLPSMEAHVLAGHKPRLISSAHQNELVESSINR